LIADTQIEKKKAELAKIVEAGTAASPTAT
jgi:hypothetical protein